MSKTPPFQNTWLFDVSVGQVVDHLVKEGDRGIVFRPETHGMLIFDSDRLKGMGTYDPTTKTYVESPF